MSQFSGKIKVAGDAYSKNKRYKVGAVVGYLGATYQNVTGVNSIPVINSVNWVLTKSAPILSRPIVLVFGNPFFLVKHPDNGDPVFSNVIQNNDFILDGFFDTVTYWPKAICLDETEGTINNAASWDPIEPLEELIII